MTTSLWGDYMALGQRHFRTSVHQHFPQNLQRGTEFSRVRKFFDDGIDIPCLPRAHDAPRLLALKFREARADKHIAAKIEQTMTSFSMSRQPAEMAALLLNRASKNLGLNDVPEAKSRIAALLIASIAHKASEAASMRPPDAAALETYAKLAGALAGNITITDDGVAILETKKPEHRGEETLFLIKHPVALGLPTETAKSVLEATKGDEQRLNVYIIQALGARTGSATQKAKPAQAQ